MGDNPNAYSRKRVEAETWMKMGKSQLQRGNLDKAGI